MKCGLLGRKLGHSYAPQIHARLGSYDYLLFESGEKGEKGYAIFLEHKADCKVCCEQFD